jgi:hypothetical protein
MAHEEGQIHQQISSRDKSGLCYAVTAIQTQDQSRPRICEHQHMLSLQCAIVRTMLAGIRKQSRPRRIFTVFILLSSNPFDDVKKSASTVDFLTPGF